MDTHVLSLMTIMDIVMCSYWKFESLERLKGFKNEVEIQIEKSIKILGLDQDGEYFSQYFQNHLKDNEIPS